MSLNTQHWIWLDLEMTGLDPHHDRIIEMAAVITTTDLEIIAESTTFVIHQPETVLSAMDAWNKEHHSRSGLIERVRKSTHTEAQAEANMLAFLQQYVPAGKSPLCGNSICLDRRFLFQYMPILERYFHYRHLDVSTLKILTQHWAPQVASGLNKESQHQALQDIRDSIEELRYYRQHFLKSA
ncbi:MAG: oligoribonuclease [Coxiella sp. RIFCSPHIGHO2_12_FULL_44_14]|nr:MAG: oligoribonuclease [Coxiella sp. RIFCSPHIGHO2_12_FULL_44_14]